MARSPFSRRAFLGYVAASGALGSLACGNTDENMPNTYGSRLYPRRASMLPDETLTLCVSCATAQFQLELWRVGADDRLVYTSDWYDGSSVTALRADVDFTYPAYEVSPPEPLAPGVYVARLFEGEDLSLIHI